MIIHNYIFDYTQVKWVHWEKNRVMTRHYRYRDDAVCHICYSYVIKDLILSTSLTMGEPETEQEIRDALKNYYNWANDIADWQIEHHGNIVRANDYVVLGDKAKNLNKILLTC